MSLHLTQHNKKQRNGSIGKGLSSDGNGFGNGYELVKTLIFFVVMAVVLKASVVEAFKIPSSSMVPTLNIGDHILVNKLSYGFRLPLMAETVVDYRIPSRGDVVVFTLPNDPGTNIIKRVIGLPGDVIEVRGMKILINGVPFEHDKDYAIWVKGGIRDFGPVTVPSEKVLLLGDNRDQSRDSRFWDDPFLDVSRIKGRAFIIYWNSSFVFKHLFEVIR